MADPQPSPLILGALLAGGQSRRMGAADKFLLPVQGQSMLAHCLERARHQVHDTIIVGNGDLTRFNEFRVPSIGDLPGTGSGPLAGIISAMHWGQKASPPFNFVATFAADTPFFPSDCVARLHAALKQNKLDVAVPRAGGQLHYTFALWSCDLALQLQSLATAENAALHRVLSHLRWQAVDFDDNGVDFFNVNTPEDWRQLEALAAPGSN